MSKIISLFFLSFLFASHAIAVLQGFQTAYLVEAARTGDLESVKEMVEGSENLNLNVHDGHGETALIQALVHDHHSVVQFLLENGADPNFKNKKGQTALMLVRHQENEDVKRLFFDKDMKDTKDRKADANPMNILEMNETFGTNKTKIQIKGMGEKMGEKIDPNCRTQECLKKAILQKNVNMVKLFLDAGMDPNEKDHHGRTALMFSAYINSLDIASLLLDAGADPRIKDHYGWTARLFAFHRGHNQLTNFFKGFE